MIVYFLSKQFGRKPRWMVPPLPDEIHEAQIIEHQGPTGSIAEHTGPNLRFLLMKENGKPAYVEENFLREEMGDLR